MSWFYLFMAGIFEIFWAVGIKYCDGFKITISFVLVIISMALSVIFLGLATKTIPMSIAYAVWTGIGIVGVFIYGLLILKDPISVKNIICVGMILIGIIGLKLGIK
ncbi:MAG: multidrug efflux SMR transporter [Rickettsiaceae bacterium]|jgi:quaternary ammonium compound-resistance protein SugE|nr:multidrug efflux SMR transporter [Rickettsiaceae bacterium]NDE19640.1 QacE family quaternary ammonium compound efflux SMR transporter [Alphaproteobacteria bacterium]UCM93649.1 MAG: multidrug efflux SMR transporter [Candidatus Megaira endosymbiont of Mesostigma viride]HJK88740.1 multidrug efflux SMR transporter [Candidatus Megaira endosymbiont of Mesostigma viride]